MIPISEFIPAIMEELIRLEAESIDDLVPHLDAKELKAAIIAAHQSGERIVYVYDCDAYELSLALRSLDHDTVGPYWNTIEDPVKNDKRAIVIVTDFDMISDIEQLDFIMRQQRQDGVLRAMAIIPLPYMEELIEGTPQYYFRGSL